MKKKSMILLVTLLFAGPVFATTAVSLSVQDLVRRSDMVIKGQITDSNAFYNHKFGMIYTRLTIHIEKDFMGKKGTKTIVVTMPGGTVNGRVQVVFGVPVLKIGEHAIMFLRRMGKRITITGLGQGTFIINPALNRVSRRLNRVTLIGEEFHFPTDLTGFEKMLKSNIQQKNLLKK